MKRFSSIALVAALVLAGCAGTTSRSMEGGVSPRSSASGDKALRQLLGKRLTADSAARVAILNKAEKQAKGCDSD
jgi:hypothetical protein